MQNNDANNKLNIIFAGTTSFAAEILKSLITESPHNILAIYTQPDRPAGRGRHLSPSAVKQLIDDTELDIIVEQPNTLKKQEVIEKFKRYNPDLIIVVAYGLIFPEEILNIPKYGCINIHASLLPRWRGAAPIQRAIMAGDDETGVSIQKMSKGLDTGPIIAMDSCKIEDTDTTANLSNKLLEIARPLLLSTIQDTTNLAKHHPQDNKFATYAHKIDKSEANINWNDAAIDINRKVRAFIPAPITMSTLKNISGQPDIIIKIIACKVIHDDDSFCPPGTIIQNNKKTIIVQTGEEQIEILKLQFSGGKIISNKDALNGKYKNLLSPGNQFKS